MDRITLNKAIDKEFQQNIFLVRAIAERLEFLANELAKVNSDKPSHSELNTQRIYVGAMGHLIELMEQLIDAKHLRIVKEKCEKILNGDVLNSKS